MTFNQNWSKESGADRTEEYRTWRTRLGFGAVGDIDQIEYSAIDGRPLLFIELCVADRKSEACPAGVPRGYAPSEAFFAQVEEKVGDRPQGRMFRYISKALAVPMLLVVYIKHELESAVWVKRTDRPDTGWVPLTIDEYTRRLRDVHKVDDARRVDLARSSFRTPA